MKKTFFFWMNIKYIILYINNLYYIYIYKCIFKLEIFYKLLFNVIFVFQVTTSEIILNYFKIYT